MNAHNLFVLIIYQFREFETSRLKPAGLDVGNKNKFDSISESVKISSQIPQVNTSILCSCTICSVQLHPIVYVHIFIILLYVLYTQIWKTIVPCHKEDVNLPSIFMYRLHCTLLFVGLNFYLFMLRDSRT